MSMGLSLGGRLLEGLDRSRTLLAEIFWWGRSFASWHVMIGDVEDVMVCQFLHGCAKCFGGGDCEALARSQDRSGS
jgi:hypothetical protein